MFSSPASLGRILPLPEVAVTASGGHIVSDRDTNGARFAAPGFGTSRDVAVRTRFFAFDVKRPHYLQFHACPGLLPQVKLVELHCDQQCHRNHQ